MVKKVTLTTTPTPKVVPAAVADQWVENRVADEGTKRLTLDIPESLHRRIKAQCAMNGVKMVDVIRSLLEEKFPEK